MNAVVISFFIQVTITCQIKLKASIKFTVATFGNDALEVSNKVNKNRDFD